MKNAQTVKLVKGKLSAKDNNELVAILKGKAAQPVKVAKLELEAVDKGIHGLAVKMASAEANHDKALNAVYTTFATYAAVELVISERLAAHNAAIADLYKVYTEARKPAAIQRVTMLNNMRTIAHGKAATRDTAAQPAQGMDKVLAVLSTCKSLPELKTALSSMKSVTHAAQGVAKVSPKATAKAVTLKADDVAIPSTREEAIKAACRILEYVSTNFLTLSKDQATIKEVEKVITMLSKAA